jgi:hypothetical protein
MSTLAYNFPLSMRGITGVFSFMAYGVSRNGRQYAMEGVNHRFEFRVLRALGVSEESGLEIATYYEVGRYGSKGRFTRGSHAGGYWDRSCVLFSLYEQISSWRTSQRIYLCSFDTNKSFHLYTYSSRLLLNSFPEPKPRIGPFNWKNPATMKMRAARAGEKSRRVA